MLADGTQFLFLLLCLFLFLVCRSGCGLSSSSWQPGSSSSLIEILHLLLPLLQPSQPLPALLLVLLLLLLSVLLALVLLAACQLVLWATLLWQQCSCRSWLHSAKEQQQVRGSAKRQVSVVCTHNAS
jgi:hypothetical protein